MNLEVNLDPSMLTPQQFLVTSLLIILMHYKSECCNHLLQHLNNFFYTLQN